MKDVFITEEEAGMAAKQNVLLELSGRKGHSLTNGHVARMAERVRAPLAVNADAHGPGDFLTAAMAETVALGAGLSRERYQAIRCDMAALVDRLPPLS